MDDVLVSAVYVPLSNEDSHFHSRESDGEWFWAVIDGSINDPELRGVNESAKILVDSYLKHGTSAHAPKPALIVLSSPRTLIANRVLLRLWTQLYSSLTISLIRMTMSFT